MCREFVEYGWCNKGEECEKRHVRECWRFSETGKCEVKGCKEPHVLRRIHQDEEESEGEESEQEEIEADAEEEMEREEKGIKRKRDSIEGISGEAGRKRSSKNKKRKATTGAGGGMQDQSDFVELFIPSSSDREEEEDQELEGSDADSVDSDDLAEDEEEQAKSVRYRFLFLSLCSRGLGNDQLPFHLLTTDLRCKPFLFLLCSLSRSFRL